MSDRKQLSRLFASHAGSVRRFFRRKIARASDASDLSQEVFLRLLRLQNLESIHDPQGYLFAVAANLVKERAYSQARQRSESWLPIDSVLDSPELAFEPTAESEIDASLLLGRLRAALRELSPRDREVLSMVYEDRLSYREIARRMGLSKSAIEKAVANATARCRKRMRIEESV